MRGWGSCGWSSTLRSPTFRQAQCLRHLRLKKCPEFTEGHIMFYLYILQGPKNHLYIGVSENIQERIKRHQEGDGAEFTKRNKTYQLVYSEKFETLLEARRRETQIKGWRREKKDNLIKFGKPIV